jgi:hypothetical protein
MVHMIQQRRLCEAFETSDKAGIAVQTNGRTVYLRILVGLSCLIVGSIQVLDPQCGRFKLIPHLRYLDVS